MLQCDLHQNLNYGYYLCLTLESAPSDLDLLPLKAPAIIVASDLELTRKLISVTIGNVRMYARLRLRPLISLKGMKGKFLFTLAPILPCTGHQRSALAVATVFRSGVILPTSSLTRSRSKKSSKTIEECWIRGDSRP